MPYLLYGRDGGFSGLVGSVLNGSQQLTARIETWDAIFVRPAFNHTGPGDGGNVNYLLGDMAGSGNATGWTQAYGGSDSAFGSPLPSNTKISGTLTLIHFNGTQQMSFPALITMVSMERQAKVEDKWALSFKWVSNGASTGVWQPIPGLV